MALFAERLQNIPAINAPVDERQDSREAGISTFRLIRSRHCRCLGPVRGVDEGHGGAPAASDPSGRYTIFESIQKQVGLKLEAKKDGADDHNRQAESEADRELMSLAVGANPVSWERGAALHRDAGLILVVGKRCVVRKDLSRCARQTSAMAVIRPSAKLLRAGPRGVGSRLHDLDAYGFQFLIASGARSNRNC